MTPMGGRAVRAGRSWPPRTLRGEVFSRTPRGLPPPCRGLRPPAPQQERPGHVPTVTGGIPQYRGGVTTVLSQQALQDLDLPENLVVEIEGRLRSQHKLLGKFVGVMCPPLFGCRTNAEPLNFSHFVARQIWRRRGASPLGGRAHHLQRREPLQGLLMPMAPTLDVLQTARN